MLFGMEESNREFSKEVVHLEAAVASFAIARYLPWSQNVVPNRRRICGEAHHRFTPFDSTISFRRKLRQPSWNCGQHERVSFLANKCHHMTGVRSRRLQRN